jgi:hypothetical protein
MRGGRNHNDIRPTNLASILDFLGIAAPPDIIADAVESNNIQRMREKENDARKSIFRGKAFRYQKGNRFVRDGKSGGWQEKLTAEQLQMIEQHTWETLTRVGYPLMGTDG